MKWYPWFNKIYKQIISSYQEEKGHHALMLYSYPGNGEYYLCYAISCWLMCSKPINMKSCGFCKNCHLMEYNNHPDFYKFDLNNQQEVLGIDYIRKIIDDICKYPSYGNIKIICIVNVNKLTEQAANALLKTIEEPPKNTYFFMICNIYERVLSTFKSRCASWILHTPDEKLGLSWLNSLGHSNKESSITALRLYNGAPIIASDLLKSSVWKERLLLCQKMEYVLLNNNFLSLMLELNKSDLNQSLYWLNSILIDAIKFQKKLYDHIFNQDMKILINKIAHTWTIDKLYKCWNYYLYFLTQYKNQEVKNINSKVLLIDYLLNLEC